MAPPLLGVGGIQSARGASQQEQWMAPPLLGVGGTIELRGELLNRSSRILADICDRIVTPPTRPRQACAAAIGMSIITRSIFSPYVP